MDIKKYIKPVAIGAGVLGVAALGWWWLKKRKKGSVLGNPVKRRKKNRKR